MRKIENAQVPPPAFTSLRQLIHYYREWLSNEKIEATLIHAGKLFVVRSIERPPEERKRFLRLCAYALEAERHLSPQTESEAFRLPIKGVMD